LTTTYGRAVASAGSTYAAHDQALMGVTGTKSAETQAPSSADDGPLHLGSTLKCEVRKHRSVTLDQAAISTVIAGVALLISAAGLIFLVIQIRLLRAQVQDAKDAYIGEQLLSRQQTTLEFLATTLDSRLGPDDEAVLKFMKDVEADPDVEKVLIAFLSCYEYIAAGVNMNALDEQAVHRTVGRTVQLAQEQFAAYVTERRLRENHPSLYHELETLAEALYECETEGRHPM
jgi:hypothetical protein